MKRKNQNGVQEYNYNTYEIQTPQRSTAKSNSAPKSTLCFNETVGKA